MIRYVGGFLRLCALVLVSLSLISCGRKNSNLNLPDPQGLIEQTTDSALPGVGMVVLPEGAGICTGTFVSERAVLTAAHCVLNSGRYSFVTNEGTFYTYEKLVMGTGSVDDPHDIALLVFEENVASQSQIHSFKDSVNPGDILRLVGLGCNSLETRRGAGVKRTGTNMVSEINDYINFLTPKNYSRGILGPSNRAGSCFGDSGGPAFAEVNGELLVVGVTHAGGYDGDNLISEYANVASRNDNRSWLRAQNTNHNLGIQGL